MYGQKTSASVVSTGVVAASWWMWSVTIVLATIAAILLARVFITMRSKNAARRP
jgi:hypothetical protein